jgi:predicted acetyltransferase
LFNVYSYLDNYWEEKERFPYLIGKDGKLAGFVLVREVYEENKLYWSIAEFFIMKKFRLSGLGKYAAHQIFEKHRGNWEVVQIEKNKPAQAFWRKVINDYTEGQFVERTKEGKLSINKLVEVAIRSLGNYDPKTATNAIYQLGEVLASISRGSIFSQYLVDKNNNLRVILQERDFNHYLYNAFGSIRHYAKDNVIVCTELLKVLDLMAKSLNKRDYNAVWEFGVFTASGFENLFLFDLD